MLVNARIIVVLLAPKLGGLLSVKPAPAAVFITFRIYLNGQLILVTGTYDNGYTSNDGLWNNLKKLLLAAPRALDFAELMPSAERIKFLREDSARRTAGLRPQHELFAIKPDADEPLQATLKGKIKVEGRYSYTREVSSLRLVRTSETGNHWQIAPEEVDRMRNLQPKNLPLR